MSGKKLLITGASGFIGSFLVEEGLKRGYEVYAGIRKTSSVQYLTDSRIKFLELNFSDVGLLSRQLSDAPHFDYVIHSAGLTKAFDLKGYRISNYQYSKNFIEVLISLNRVPEKFMYMSSLAAYGPGDPLNVKPVSSSDTPHPVTAYGKSKLEAEKYLGGLNGFPYISIRPTAVYGPREKDLFTVFSLINKHIELGVGFKKQYLSFVYVKDAVKAAFLAMESEAMNKGYFVSDGNVYDSQIFGTVIKQVLGRKTIRIQLPLGLVRLIAVLSESTKYITRKQPVLNLDKVKELESVNWKCDIQPLRDDLKFEPEYDLDKGIRETIEWYRQAGWL